MDYVSDKDFYEIRLASLISNIDKDVIIELYQPLIGAQAAILYLSLVKQKRNEESDDVYQMDGLLSLMQFSPSVMLSARHCLEAVGLLRTYEKSNSDMRYFIYVLYAPKTPKEFFDDVLFKGLLIQYIGEKEAKTLASHYRVDLKIPDEYQEISSSFVDVFNPDYNDASFKKNFGEGIVGHEVGRVKIEFNYDLFFRYVEENSQILKSVFTNREMKEIERIATLFGLDEKSMASIVIDEYAPDSTPHLNFSNIADRAKDQIKFPFLQKKGGKSAKSVVSGEGVLASKISMMEDMPPARFLRLLQNNTKPADNDLNTVDSLSANYGFSNGVINVIVDYVLKKCDNVLNRKYCESVASSLSREGIQTAVDAMNYFNRAKTSNRKSSKPYEKSSVAKPETEANQETKPVEKISDQEMNDILSIFDKK